MAPTVKDPKGFIDRFCTSHVVLLSPAFVAQSLNSSQVPSSQDSRVFSNVLYTLHNGPLLLDASALITARLVHTSRGSCAKTYPEQEQNKQQGNRVQYETYLYLLYVTLLVQDHHRLCATR